MARSSEFRIFETAEFRKSLARLGIERILHRRIEHRVYSQLRQEPHFGPNIKKLRDYEPPTWRFRISSYRIFYTVDNKSKIVSILTIDNRKNAYR